MECPLGVHRARTLVAMAGTETRPTPLAAAIGGVRGVIDSGTPALVFVVVAALSTLHTAVVVALCFAAGLFVLRVARREPVRYAVSGCFGVAISALVALRLGRAEGFFLPGIVVNAIYTCAFVASVVVRRPLVGVIVGALGRPAPSGAAAAWTTLLWAGVFGLRAAVQGVLYLTGHPGWLAVVRLAMGWPLTLGALAVTAWAVRRTTTAPAPDPVAQVPS